ncbi:MAG: NfeD family protein [Clostridia bacterium]|nr:NfeD family protein [Clostridia bacterium]
MWNDWTTLQQVYFCIAVLFSVVLLVQLVLTLIGAGHDGEGVDLTGDGNPDVTVDADSGLAPFTLKGLVSFFAVGGWVGFALGDGTLHTVWVILISLAAGLAALVAVGFILKGMAKLQSNGAMDINNAVGKTAEVYLTIPPKCSGAGKITVEIQGSLTEMNAMTEGDEPLKTGSKVKVVKTDNATCYVEKIY